MRRALIVIGKAPVPGAVKTRLAPPLTRQAAAALYSAFLTDTLDMATRLGWESIAVVHPKGDAPLLRVLAPSVTPSVTLLEQPGEGLGNALSFAFAWHFEQGYEKVVLIGSDNPTLGVEPILAAEAALGDSHDLAIGPTSDGGYYLIGMCQAHLAVFEAIEWSTQRVFAQTARRARALGLRVHSVEQWYDVDEPLDLERLRTDLARLPATVAPLTRACFKSMREPVGAVPVPTAPRTRR
jgi:uncharacterized protein